ncbi:MAG: glycosyltransferase [Peptococcaceae bacterium]|nr:glycosyltransferase [Peptococcaceae bacterium]
MRVAILTLATELISTDSIVSAVVQHLDMLLNAGNAVKILADLDCFNRYEHKTFLDPRIQWVKLGDSVKDDLISWSGNLKRTGQFPRAFFQGVDIISEMIRNNLSDVDICILYDILQQERYLGYNLAIRKVQEALPNIRFIAFTYSPPVKSTSKTVWPFSTVHSSMPNTIYVAPSRAEMLALGEQYAISEDRCRVVYTSLDILSPLSGEVKGLANETDLLSPEILMVYPARLTPGKKFDKVTTFAATIKNKTKSSVKAVFCDFPSTDINPELYKALIRRLGHALNLADEDIVFTSDLGYTDGFPRSGVLDLFTLSNLFVCPSFSESFGLIALEAASRGNFLVLNEKVPALEELGAKLQTYFMRWDARNFGFDSKETYYPSEQNYLEEQVSKVLNLMHENPVVYSKTMIRQKYSPKWIWQNQFAQLLTP